MIRAPALELLADEAGIELRVGFEERFRQPSLRLRQIDDVPSSSVDAGSISRFDARLDNVLITATGRYVVGAHATVRRAVSLW